MVSTNQKLFASIRFFIVLVVICLMVNCNHTNVPSNGDNSKLNEMEYDSVLAKKLGADDYGMKQYVMAFLKSGPNRSHDSAEAMQLQRAHLDNIIRLTEEGKLVLAGPFMDSGDIRGIYIFDVKTVEEARELTATDPAIKAGRLEMELHPWYGSAAIKKMQELHKKIAKISI